MKARAKHDITNTVVAGCVTGGAISAKGIFQLSMVIAHSYGVTCCVPAILRVIRPKFRYETYCSSLA